MKTTNNISLNAIVARHTAFSDFSDLMNAKGNYRPTISMHTPDSVLHKRWNTELRFLADQYDAAMAMLGDERRTYRSNW